MKKITSHTPIPSPPRKKAAADRPRWTYGPPQELGSFGRVRAVPGFRTAVVELRPGMYLINFVPVEAVEMGFLPLMAPAIVKTVQKVFHPKGSAEKPGAASPEPVKKALPVRIPWLDGETAEDLGIQCPEECSCRRSS